MNYTCECGKEFEFSEELAGKKARCKQCERIFRIPSSEKSLDSESDVIDLEDDSSIVLESAIFEEIRVADDAIGFAAEQAESAVSRAEAVAEEQMQKNHVIDFSLKDAVDTARREVNDIRHELDEARRCLRHAEVTLTYWQDRVNTLDKDRDDLVAERDYALELSNKSKLRAEELAYKLEREKCREHKDLEELRADTIHLAELCEKQEERARLAADERDQVQQNLLRALEDVDDARRQIQELKNSLSRQKQNVQNLEQEFQKQLEDERARAGTEISRVEEEKSKLAAELRDVRARLKKAQADMQEMESNACARDAQMNVSANRLKAEMAQSQSDAARIRDEFAALQKELAAEREKLEKTQDALRQRERTHETELLGLQSQIELAKDEQKKQQNTLITTEAQHLSAKTQLMKELELLKQNREKDATRIAELQGELQGTRAKKDRAIEELQKSIKDNRRLREELEVLQDELKHNQDAKSQMTTVLNTALEQARQARLELDEAESEIQTIRQERERLSRQAAQNAEAATAAKQKSEFERARLIEEEEIAQPILPAARLVSSVHTTRQIQHAEEVSAEQAMIRKAVANNPQVVAVQQLQEESDIAETQAQQAPSTEQPVQPQPVRLRHRWSAKKSAFPFIVVLIIGCILWGVLSSLDIRISRGSKRIGSESTTAQAQAQTQPTAVQTSSPAQDVQALSPSKNEPVAQEEIAACKPASLPKNEVEISAVQTAMATNTPKVEPVKNESPVARFRVCLPPLPGAGN